MGLFNKLFGSYSDRELKKIYPIADAVEKLDAQYSALSDDELRAKTDEVQGPPCRWGDAGRHPAGGLRRRA